MKLMRRRMAVKGLVGIAFLSGIEQAAFAARVRKANRATKSIGRNQSGRLVGIQPGMEGWHLDLDESVDWQLVVQNPKNAPALRVTRCKPFTTGPWEIVATYDVTGGDPPQIDKNIGHVDNEDQFFCVHRKEGDKWVMLRAAEGHSSATVSNDGRSCGMTWMTDKGVVKVSVWAH